MSLRMMALLIALIGVWSAGRADAACQVSASTPMTFSSGSSYDVRGGLIAATSSGAGFTCAGSLITLASSNRARATVTSANAFSMKGPGGDSIAYKLAADSNYNTLFTQGGTIDYMSPTLLSLLTILNGGSFAPKMYAAIAGSPNIAAGIYTDTLTVDWAWNICHGAEVLDACVLGETGAGSAYIQVKLEVGKDCRISATPIAFGSAALASQFSSVTQAVAVDCSKGSTYSVAFSSGSSGQSRPWRAMTDGAGHSLQYNIYLPDGTTVWDEANPQPSTLQGTGALIPAQLQTYRARINPDQTTPPAGHYTDTVSVVVTF